MKQGITARITRMPVEAPRRLDARVAVSAPESIPGAKVLSNPVLFGQIDEYVVSNRLGEVRQALVHERVKMDSIDGPKPDLLEMLIVEEENKKKKKAVVNIAEGLATLIAKGIEMMLVPEQQRVIGKSGRVGSHGRSEIDNMLLYATMMNKARNSKTGVSESAPTDKLLEKARSAQAAKSRTDSTVKSN